MTTRRISRRQALVTGLAGAGAAALGGCGDAASESTPSEAPPGGNAPQPGRGVRAVVVGAGAFGGWTALWLRRAGAEVTLVDAWGPGNSRASSGGETRLIRASYGTRRIYSEMVVRALEIWKEHQARWDDQLFYPVGTLRIRSGEADYARAAAPILKDLGLGVEELDGDEIARRFPQINPEGLTYGLFEPDAGYLLARQGCERVLAAFVEEGGNFVHAEAAPGTMEGGRMRDVRLPDGSSLEADVFVFACGPWLARLFPEFDPPLVQPTRQEVFFFGPPAGGAGLTEETFPTWIGPGLFYGVPGNRHRGFKVADDRRGEPFDPTTGDRTPSAKGLREAREYLEHRFPAMRGAPLTEARVCQYEQSADGNLIVDTHPEASNAWIAGGGSGHGYKLGASLGEMLAGQVLGEREKEPFFGLARFGG
jgi:glycine/D-amino acid oxidase-like deaminating enzyme